MKDTKILRVGLIITVFRNRQAEGGEVIQETQLKCDVFGKVLFFQI